MPLNQKKIHKQNTLKEEISYSVYLFLLIVKQNPHEAVYTTIGSFLNGILPVPVLQTI
jgi:hypothetical protein